MLPARLIGRQDRSTVPFVGSIDSRVRVNLDVRLLNGFRGFGIHLVGLPGSPSFLRVLLLGRGEDGAPVLHLQFLNALGFQLNLLL